MASTTGFDSLAEWDIVIVGGGAAGLFAAVTAAREPAVRSVAVLEKAPRVGRKLLATGNGTCNLSNAAPLPARYHGGQPGFPDAALRAFPPARVRELFESVGLSTVLRADGRIYPLCGQASAVLDCLRLELAARSVEERTDTPVTAVTPDGRGFRVSTPQGECRARRVLIATGGSAAPALGGSAGAFGLLTALGHTRTPLFPSIVQVKTESAPVRAVKGVRADAEVAFLLDGRELARETGEALFTEYGLSGPAVMQISRLAADWERRRQGRLTARLNLLPGTSFGELLDRLTARAGLPGRARGDLLTGLLPKRLGQALLRAAGIGGLDAPAHTLTQAELRRAAGCVAGWTLEVEGTQGWGGAQVTAGGIDTRAFNPVTMESRLVPGVYAAGEVLDVDGDCGGFNLQWAWASAHAAAQAMARSLAAPPRKSSEAKKRGRA